MKQQKANPIIFAGAGPGDPELITVKAMSALKRADFILYAGSLVPEAVLCWKGSQTQTCSSAGMNLKEIIEFMKIRHMDGKHIVRLHTGDPSLYGAIFEQIRELNNFNIPYEVIPGVTAAFAASAAMKMEYTLPELTQTLILTRISGATPVPDTEKLDALAGHNSSMAIYLSIGHVERVSQILKRHYGENGGCAVAYKVSHPEEQIHFCHISTLVQTCAQNNIRRHALIIVGPCVDACQGNHVLLKSKLYDPGFSHGYRAAKE